MKRFISSALAASMILGSATFPSLASQFSDVNGHWGENAIERWLSYGIVEGDEHGNFNPDAVTSRAQMAQFLANLLNLKAKADISGYADVNVNAWYADAIAKCVAAGILKGTDEGMSPNAEVTREQAFVMFARAVGIDEQNSMDTAYPDSASVSGWAEGYINALINEGYISGTGDGTIAPLATINRASIMQLFDNTITHYANVPGTVLDVNESGLALVVADGVTVKGNADTLVVTSKNVNLDGAKITNLEIVAADSSVSLSGGATVENANIAQAADGASLNVDKSSTVNTLVSGGENVTVSGEGTVKDAVVSGNNTAIDTAGTNLKVEEGVTGTTNNGTSVSGGTTVETKPSTPSTGGGSTGPSYTTVDITEDKTIDENTVIDSYTTWNVAEGVTLTVNGTLTVEGKLNVNGALTGGKVEIMKGGDVKIDAHASKLPVSTEIKVNAGGVLSADSTSDGSRIEIIGDDSASRIHLTDGNAVFTFTNRSTKPKLAITGTANVPTGVTAYNHFGTAPDIIGIEMTVNGDFTVDGTFNVTSANGTVNETPVSGSAMTVANGSTLTVNGTLSVASKGTVTNNGTIINNGIINGKVDGTVQTGSVVKTAEKLTEALADGEVEVITIEGTIGSESQYGTYTVARPVTIKGENGSKVYGSFIVKADGAAFDGMNIKNEGSEASDSSSRNAINAYTNKIAITNSTFESDNKFANGIVIFPSDESVDFDITGNTFIGYNQDLEGWSTSALIITGGYNMAGKPFFEISETSKDASNVNDDAIVRNNTFESCSKNYSRTSYTTGSEVVFAGYNYNALSRAGENAVFYFDADKGVVDLSEKESISSDIIIMDGGDVRINANASKLPENCEITVEAGGVLSAISTADNSTPIEIIGNDSSSRIELTEGNAVFTFGETGTKPTLSINGTANVPASVTAYNHFGSEGDIIGIDMTVNGGFTVDGTFKVSSANSTGSTLTIADGSALTVNGTLSVAAKGTVVNNGTMTDNGSFVNNGTFTNNGSFESSGVLGTILEATGYTYEDREYIGKFNPVILSGTAVRFDGTYSAEQAAKEEGSAIMNDMARFLGALYRIDDGASVTKLTYKGTEYTWNAEGILAGSNWEDESGKTLVSAIIDDYKQNSFQLNPIEITVNDEVEMTLNASVGQ